MYLGNFAKSAAKGMAAGIVTGLVIINIGSAVIAYPFASRGIESGAIERQFREYSHNALGPVRGEIFHKAISIGRGVDYLIVDYILPYFRN